MTGKWTKRSVFALCLLVALSLSQPAMADSMELTGVYNTGAVMGGVYDSPYWVTIDGVQMLAICDDFQSDVSTGQTWTADQHGLSDVTEAGPQKFTVGQPSGFGVYNVNLWTTGSTTLTIKQEYYAAAWLAVQLMQPANLNDPTNAGEYSYAIWTIFDPSAINGYSGGIGPSYQAEINNLRSDAFAAALAPNPPTLNVALYTPDPKSASQEFLVVKTPEVSAVAMLALDLIGLFGAIVLVRRRKVSAKARV